MKKIKFFIASMLGAIALVFATVFGTRVNANIVSQTWKADDETDTSFSVSSTVEDNDIFKIEINTGVAYTKTADNSTATADDEELTFSNALVSNGSANSVANGIKVTTKVDDVTLKFYYTVSDSKFASKDQSKSGNFKLSDGTSDVFTSTKTSDKSNKVAYTDSYSLANAGSIIAYTSGNRLCLFAVTGSYETAGENQTAIVFYDGSTKLAKKIYDYDSTIDYKPTTSTLNYRFDYWCIDSALTTPLSSTTASSETPTTLYAKWVMCDTYLDSRNIVDNSYSSAVTKETVNYYSNSVFNLVTMGVTTNNGMTMPYGEKNDYRLVTNSSGSSEKNSINFVAPYDCSLVLLTATGDTKRVGYVYEDSYDNENLILTITSTATNTLTISRVDIKAGKTYYIGSSNSIYIYGIYLGDKSFVTSSIAAQFDNDSAPTKLRLVGVIDGLKPAEYAEISNLTFDFDFNGKSFTKNCTSIYKSVSSVKSDFTSGTYKLYVVLTIDGVSKYTAAGDKSIENIKMTINFEDGTQKIVTRDDVLLAPKA